MNKRDAFYKLLEMIRSWRAIEIQISGNFWITHDAKVIYILNCSAKLNDTIQRIKNFYCKFKNVQIVDFMVSTLLDSAQVTDAN